MSELVEVQRESDGEYIVVDVDTAKTMKDNDELIIPDDNNGLSLQDIFGSDYTSSGTLSGI